MLENLIAKYKKEDVEEVVYRLSYGGKFLIVKGKTLSGSLYFIALGFDHYIPNTKKGDVALYRFFYDHVIANPNKRFTVRMLAKKSSKTSHYELLRTEQRALSANRFNEKCLNNATEAYIPLYNESTGKYGWLDKSAVMNFKRYLQATGKPKGKSISLKQVVDSMLKNK